MRSVLKRSVLCGVLVVSGGVLADTPATTEDEAARPTPEAIFERIDRDGSGWIDPEELRNAMMRRFARLDADGDGVLLGQEIPQRSLVVAEVADTQHVTRDDFHDAVPRTLERIDSDRNGVLSLDEFRAAREAARQEPKP